MTRRKARGAPSACPRKSQKSMANLFKLQSFTLQHEVSLRSAEVSRWAIVFYGHLLLAVEPKLMQIYSQTRVGRVWQLGENENGRRTKHVAITNLMLQLNLIKVVSPSMRMANVSPTLSRYSVVHHHAPIGIFCLRE